MNFDLECHFLVQQLMVRNSQIWVIAELTKWEPLSLLSFGVVVVPRWGVICVSRAFATTWLLWCFARNISIYFDHIDQLLVSNISFLLLVTVLCIKCSNGLSGDGWAMRVIALVLPVMRCTNHTRLTELLLHELKILWWTSVGLWHPSPPLLTHGPTHGSISQNEGKNV